MTHKKQDDLEEECFWQQEEQEQSLWVRSLCDMLRLMWLLWSTGFSKKLAQTWKNFLANSRGNGETGKR